MKKNNRKGFTIVELVIVIAVIAILATVLVPTFGGVIEKAQNSKIIQEAKNEYTNYCLDNADGDTYSSNVIVEVDDKFVVILDGTVYAETIYDSETAAKSAHNTVTDFVTLAD